MVEVFEQWVIVTGGTSGLGLEISKEMARKGYNVLIGCRNSRSGAVTCNSLKAVLGEECQARLECYELELSELSSIRKFARHVQEQNFVLSAIINNAAVYAPPHGSKTRNGLDMSFGVNYVAPFYLTNLLLPFIGRQQSPCTIINIGCGEYKLCRSVDLGFVQEQARLVSAGGFLLVTVESARNLPASCIGRKANPYVRVFFHGVERCTRTVLNTDSPVWHEHVSYPRVDCTEQDQVQFIVMDRGKEISFLNLLFLG
jgi:hypothetical protein